VLPDVPVVVAPAAVPVVEAELGGMTFRTNPDALLLALVLPLVPVVPAVAVEDSRCKHPVTVMESDADVDVGR